MKSFFSYLVLGIGMMFPFSNVWAASMGSAQITAVRNSVEKVENNQGKPALVSDSVVEGDMVRTRSESLAELTFSDKTITRMGSNSQFSYTSQERLVKIEKGTVLMHTPPGNGGATITSGGVTGAISGTSSFLLTANPAICTKKPCQEQMRERPNELDPLKRYYCEDHPDVPQTPSTGGFAIVVLEGKDVTKVTGPNGMTVELRPGQMAVVGPVMDGAPRVFTVDLATIIRTCPLIQAFPTPLPSIGDIVRTAMVQQQMQGIKTLDLTGVALSQDGDVLVSPSDPPSPFKSDFEMASNTEGAGQKLTPAFDDDVDTSAGGPQGTPFVGPTPPAPAPPIPPNPPIPPPPNSGPSPSILPTALTVTGPATLVAGQLATFTVSMNAPASTPTVVTLNNDFRFGDAPITVTIPAGATSVDFTAQIPSAGINFSSGSANILASASGMTSGSYSKNLVPTPLPDSSYAGAIAGSSESPTSDLRGAKMNLFASHDITLNGVDANRVGQGMEVTSFSGKVTIQGSTFDGWMQKRITPFVIPDFGYGLTTFEETANVAVTAPVLAIKMSPTTPTGSLFTPDGTMFLGDYIVRVQLDPNKVPMSGDEVGVNFLDHTAIGPDPFDFGSVANGADLILYDGATTSVNTIDYNSIDVAAGEYKPDSPASGLNGPSAAGNWEVRASDNSIGGEGQVDEVKLKYGYSKAIIQGAKGVELVDVQFQGMEEVEVMQDLNNRVLLSGTLASDPKISKMIVQAGQALQAHFDSDATVKNLAASGSAEILAGVRPTTGGGYEFINSAPGSPEQVLEMQTATLAGQLSLASHTVVFNNANITSGGVIQVRTRDGMVNMNYGSVVPGTTSFIGASGNNFHNTANGVSMTIANSGNISSAFTAGKLTDVGTPGAATVMNVGKVQ